MLTIAQKDFVEAFGAIFDFLDRRPRVDTSMTCSAGKLLVRTEGMEIEIPVQGHYEGVIWLTGESTYGLAQVARHRPPQPDTQVTICDGIMRVGRMTLPVRYEDSATPNSIFVPKDAPLLFWLSLGYQFSANEIAAAQIDDMLAAAFNEKGALIEQGASLLAPLGVTTTDLEKFVEVCIRANHKPPDSSTSKVGAERKTTLEGKC